MAKKNKPSMKKDEITAEDDKKINMFFKAMFHTFGYTLLAFIGLLFILFLVLWIRK